MILTGSEITKRVTANEITIDPFDEIQINPNSYNYRLGPTLGVPLIRKNEVKYDFIEIPPEGYQ
ncbi:dCTP deaminase domain-containing protein, partial [Pseudomonas viridiflava]|uniref:dCTP deaminase domain-containing protein n=3 Tax=Pseudomonas TaxID=286 RepID=UPI003D663ABA